MTKLFNQYYTKKFGLPDMFTAMNGAIQYFELTTGGVSLTAADPKDPEHPTIEEALAIASAQANYLRVLEVLRSNGAQPVITYVDGEKLGFTLEQTWVYGERGPMQVSAHYGEKDGDERSGLADEENKYVGLKDGAVEEIKKLFKNVPVLEATSESGKIEDIVVAEKVESDNVVTFDSVDVSIKVTVGSLNANKVDLA